MKRTTWLVAIALLVCLTTAACGGGGGGASGAADSIVGTTWALSGGEAMGISISMDDLAESMGEMTFTFDSETEYTGNADGASQSGKYTRDGDKITFDEGYEATISGNEMKMEMDVEGLSVALVFTKK